MGLVTPGPDGDIVLGPGGEGTWDERSMCLAKSRGFYRWTTEGGVPETWTIIERIQNFSRVGQLYYRPPNGPDNDG